MYAFGENQPGRDDYRPEVHDSDGLSIQLGDGEWIWRPLVNPKRLLVTSFAHDQSARLRPDAARPLAGELRGPRGALRAPAERLGRADRQLGRRAGSSWCRSRRPTRPTTTSSPTGCRRRRRRPASRSTSPTGSTGRAAGTAACRQGLGRADAARPRLRQAGPTATSTSSSISTARRCARSPRRADVEPVIWVDANAEVRERNLFQNRGQRRLAHDRSLQAQRRRPSRSSCAPTCKQQQTDPDRDMELHPSRRAGQAMTAAAIAAPAAARAARCRAVPWAGPPLAPAAAPPARPPAARAAGAAPSDRPAADGCAGCSCSPWSLLGACVGTAGDGRGAARARRGARRARPAGPVRHPVRAGSRPASGPA